MNFRNSKFALLLGAINGIIFYLAYQPVSAAYVKYLWYIKNDNYVYISLPEIYRIARDAGEFFVWTLLFALASYTAHRLWATKLKSTVALWLRVAILALAVPVACLWLVHLLLFLIVSAQMLLGSQPFYRDISDAFMRVLIREGLDIKFEVVLFAVALTVNFVYGAVISKVSSRFAK